MATSQAQGDSVKCSICYEGIKKLRKFPGCAHAFCENCLLAYITNVQSTQEDVLEIQCPNCRKETYLSNESLEDLRTWVKSLEAFESAVIGMATTSEEGRERSSKVCISCKGAGKNTVAEKYCIECAEYLCAACSRVIHAVRKLTNHLVVDYEHEIENEKTTGTTAVLADYFSCSKHPERIISCVCGEHDTLCCTRCLLDDHNSCVAYSEIQDRASALQNETDLNELKKQIKTLSEQINLINEFKKTNVAIQKQKVEEIRNQIAELRIKVNKIFDSLEDDIGSQARALVKEYTISTDDEIQHLKNIGKPLKLFDSLADRVKENGSEAHAFILFHKLKLDIMDVKDKVLTMRYCENLELSLNFGDLVNELKQLDPNDTNKLVRVEAIPVLTSPPNFPEEHECFVPKTITNAKVYEILPKETPNYSPTYSDVHYLANNKLFLVDCYSQQMCCMTNTELIPKNCLKLEKTPTRTTSISLDKIALFFENEKTIHILSENLQTVGQISTKFIPKAICGMKNDRLAVSWCDPLAFGVVSLRTNNMDNEEKYSLKEIAYFDHDKAQRHFKTFDYIAVDERRGHIIQPCTLDKSVYGFDLVGNPRFKYSHKTLVSPHGVACDRDGYIYVCETKNSGIHILSPDGVGIQIIKEGVVKPLAISVNHNINELALTRYSDPWNKVTVFEIMCNKT